MSGLLADALRRDDLPWIAAFLDRPLVPESALRQLLDHDARTAHLALLHLRRAVRARRSRDALTALAERPDEEVIALLLHAVRAKAPRVRLHAHRLLRGAAERDVYLEATATLLADPLPDVRMSAIRILTFARYLPVVPAIVEMLGSPHNGVRRAAADGLVLLGEAAAQELRRTARAARPDRRAIYEEVLARIERGVVSGG